MSKELAANLSRDLFEDKLTLEYEKLLRNALVFKKKMYAGFDPVTKTIVMKGIAAKRRNFTPFARETFTTVLEFLCKNGNVDGALGYVKDRFSLILRIMDTPWPGIAHYGIKLEDFSISSGVKHISEYKNTRSLPLGYHMNQKLANPIVPGGRISFVHVYDKTNPLHNASKRKSHWLPGAQLDTALPVGLVQQREELVIDMYSILKQHSTQLAMYFSAISHDYELTYWRIYHETLKQVISNRGGTYKTHEIRFLNM